MYCNVSFPPPLLEDGRKQFSYWNVQLVHHFITDLGCSISFFFFLLPIHIEGPRHLESGWHHFGEHAHLEFRNVLRLTHLHKLNCFSKIHFYIVQIVYLKNKFFLIFAIVHISMGNFIDLGKSPFSKKVINVDQQRA